MTFESRKSRAGSGDLARLSQNDSGFAHGCQPRRGLALASFLLGSSSMRVRPISLLFGLTSLLASCVGGDDDYDDARARGDLGAGDFAYGCLNETDLTCDESDYGLPHAIAVGGRFDFSFKTKSGPQPTVIAPASDFVRSIEGGFQVRAPGVFALLAVNGNREVVDLKHLRGAEIEEIRVQEDGSDLPSTKLSLARRQALRVLAIPYGIRGVQLGGALSYSWTSGDDALVSIETSSTLNRVRLRAGNKSGKTELSIDVGGKTFSVAVEVGPDESPLDAGAPGDAAIDASDGASDAGSDAWVDAESEGGAP